MDTSFIINLLEILYDRFGYLVAFFSSFIEVSPLGWTIPGGFLLAAAGFFAYGSTTNLLATIVFAWFGGWFTFVLAYYLGATTGYNLVKTFKQEKNSKRAKILLKKHGAIILTTSMLANMTRFWVAYVAGIQRFNFLKFVVYSGVASLTWSGLMIILGYFAGSERDALENSVGRVGIIGWVLVGLALGVVFLTVNKEFRKK